MAIYKENIVDIELTGGNIHRSFLNRTIGEGDIKADRFGVHLLRNGAEVDLSGATCAGYFIRPDGSTVAITGAVNNNRAYVTLPDTCYAVEGQFALAIKLTGDGVTGTMRIVDGVVANTTTDVAVDPGTIIPSVETLIEAINDAVETIPPDYSALYTAVEKENLEGLATITNKYINGSGAEAANSNTRCSDYIPIPMTATGVRMYVLYGGSTVISPVAAVYDENKTFIRTLSGSGHTDGVKDIPLPHEARFIRFNVSKSSSADDGHRLVQFLNYDTIRSMDLIGTDTLSATSSNKTSSHGWTLLREGVPYKLCAVVDKSVSTRYRFFLYSIAGDQVITSYYTEIAGYNNSAIFIPPQDSYLCLYNIDELSTISVTVQIYEYKQYPVTHTERVFYVNKSTRMFDKSSFTSLTACLLALKNDENPKTIYIEAGDYDIYQEYLDANVPIYTGDDPTSDYYAYCVWVPKNTHIIGRGLVRLIWNPPTTDLTMNQSKTVSPLNVAATATIENIEVHCKNGRYCLHNDGGNRGQFIGAIQRYINCRFYKYISDTKDGTAFGNTQTIGFGLSARMIHEYDGCEFWNEDSGSNCNPFYGHTRTATDSVTLQEADSATIYLKNCILRGEYGNTMRLDCVANDNLHVRMNIESCYLEHNIKVNENDHQNAYDITILNCNSFNVNGITTRYYPRVFPPVS